MDDNRSRVMFIGDSYTFGWAVNQHETLTNHTERWFSNSYPELNVEALNLGVPGYNTILEFHHLQQNIDKYNPDSVVLVYVVNDGEPQRNHYQLPSDRYRYVDSWLLAYVKQQINYYLFAGEEKLSTGMNLSIFDYLVAFEENGPKWAAGRQAFADIAALCREKSIPLLVIIFPDVSGHLDHQYRFGPIHSEVRKWCQDNEVDVIDLYGDFEGEDYKLYSVAGDGHPNGRAFSKVAELISPAIAKYLQ